MGHMLPYGKHCDESMLESFILHVVERNKEVEHNVMMKPSEALYVPQVGRRRKIYPIRDKPYPMHMMLFSNILMHVLEVIA